jgi:ABC-type multidrug transport system ATPase subunit
MTRSFIDAVIGLRRPHDGAVLVDDLDPNAHAITVRRRLCVVAQREPLRPHLPVWRQVQFLVELGGEPRPLKRDVITALRVAELPDDRMNALASALTAFERLCVWLAVHRLRKTRGLIVDQPDEGITGTRVTDVVGLLHEAASDGAAVLVTTGDETFARRLADETFRFERGNLVPVGRGH